jgi:hypothetical protein
LTEEPDDFDNTCAEDKIMHNITNNKNSKAQTNAGNNPYIHMDVNGNDILRQSAQAVLEMDEDAHPP